MKLGLFSYSYHLAFGKHDIFNPINKMDIFEFMDICFESELEGCQIDIMHLENTTDAYLERVKAYAAGNSILNMDQQVLMRDIRPRS